MHKKLYLILLTILLLGVVSAGNTYYNQDSGDEVLYKEKVSKTYYDQDDDYAVTRTLYAYYDNEDRYSTYDYRHGYSYRNTPDYWEGRYDYTIEEVSVEDLKDDYHDDYWYKDYDNRRRHYYDDYYDAYDAGRYDYQWLDDDYGGNRVQYKYYPQIRRGIERNCYDYVPRGKLFYISCGDYLY